ncbi:MAG: LPP20 family lipoprotein [Campylobacterota bacterium]|nr:LPP20 family lipoprotein [Campylobacterota bacterium]
MKKTLISLLALGFLFSGCLKEEPAPVAPVQTQEYVSTEAIAEVPQECECAIEKSNDCDCQVLSKLEPVRIIVVGQGVAPCTGTCSPEQALVLAKRAAIIDGYRLIAEKVKGVYVQGRDYVHNMMVKSSKVRTYVDANIRNANVVDTIYKDGLCEVEMEITLNYSQLVY